MDVRVYNITSSMSSGNIKTKYKISKKESHMELIIKIHINSENVFWPSNYKETGNERRKFETSKNQIKIDERYLTRTTVIN